MSNGPTEIVFRESRASAALVIVALLTLDILATVLTAMPTEHHAGKSGKVFGSILLALICATQLFYLIKMGFPSSLTLTNDGAHRVGAFGRFSLDWQDYKPAKVAVKFSPKGGRSYYIRLEPKSDAEAVEIFRDGYTQPGEHVFRCVTGAQSGRLIDPGDAPFPYGIILGWIPFFLGVSGVLLWKFESVLSSILPAVKG